MFPNPFHVPTRRSHKVGLPPGSLVHVGPTPAAPPRITVIDYTAGQCERRDNVPVGDCTAYRHRESVTWINVDGVHDTAVIERLGTDFGIPPLFLEDIVHTAQRPKVEDSPDLLFVVLKMVRYDTVQRAPTIEQVSLVVTPHAVLTFQEREGDVFDPIRDRILNGKGQVRQMGNDYLAYVLIDTVVDHMFVVLEEIANRLEAVDRQVIANPRPDTLHEIHSLKVNLIMLRKAIWPLREVLTTLSRGDLPLIRPNTIPYLRDVLDHSMRVMENLESFREMVGGLFDIYLSSVSHRTNEVMKVLTIMATIFIPLTFIVGVYGMNFDHMPELHWRYGYGFVWIVMITALVAMLLWFRRKRWI